MFFGRLGLHYGPNLGVLQSETRAPPFRFRGKIIKGRPLTDDKWEISNLLSAIWYMLSAICYLSFVICHMFSVFCHL